MRSQTRMSAASSGSIDRQSVAAAIGLSTEELEEHAVRSADATLASAAPETLRTAPWMRKLLIENSQVTLCLKPAEGEQ